MEMWSLSSPVNIIVSLLSSWTQLRLVLEQLLPSEPLPREQARVLTQEGLEEGGRLRDTASPRCLQQAKPDTPSNAYSPHPLGYALRSRQGYHQRLACLQVGLVGGNIPLFLTP